MGTLSCENDDVVYYNKNNYYNVVKIQLTISIIKKNVYI